MGVIFEIMFVHHPYHNNKKTHPIFKTKTVFNSQIQVMTLTLYASLYSMIGSSTCTCLHDDLSIIVMLINSLRLGKIEYSELSSEIVFQLQ